MSWWKFWEYKSKIPVCIDSGLPEIKKVVPMPPAKPPKKKAISEPVFAIVNSIMNDKKRWEFWAHGVKGGDYWKAFEKGRYNSYDNYTKCTLKDTKTSTELQFQAVLDTSFGLGKGWGCGVRIARGYKFYIIHTWMTEEEKNFVIDTLSMWWQIRIAKAEAFYSGVEERSSIRSKQLQDKINQKERDRLMEIFCKEE